MRNGIFSEVLRLCREGEDIERLLDARSIYFSSDDEFVTVLCDELMYVLQKLGDTEQPSDKVQRLRTSVSNTLNVLDRLLTRPDVHLSQAGVAEFVPVLDLCHGMGIETAKLEQLVDGYVLPVRRKSVASRFSEGLVVAPALQLSTEDILSYYSWSDIENYAALSVEDILCAAHSSGQSRLLPSHTSGLIHQLVERWWRITYWVQTAVLVVDETVRPAVLSFFVRLANVSYDMRSFNLCSSVVYALQRRCIARITPLWTAVSSSQLSMYRESPLAVFCTGSTRINSVLSHLSPPFIFPVDYIIARAKAFIQERIEDPQPLPMQFDRVRSFMQQLSMQLRAPLRHPAAPPKFFPKMPNLTTSNRHLMELSVTIYSSALQQSVLMRHADSWQQADLHLSAQHAASLESSDADSYSRFGELSDTTDSDEISDNTSAGPDHDHVGLAMPSYSAVTNIKEPLGFRSIRGMLSSSSGNLLTESLSARSTNRGSKVDTNSCTYSGSGSGSGSADITSGGGSAEIASETPSGSGSGSGSGGKTEIPCHTSSVEVDVVDDDDGTKTLRERPQSTPRDAETADNLTEMIKKGDDDDDKVGLKLPMLKVKKTPVPSSISNLLSGAQTSKNEMLHRPKLSFSSVGLSVERPTPRPTPRKGSLVEKKGKESPEKPSRRSRDGRERSKSPRKRSRSSKIVTTTGTLGGSATPRLPKLAAVSRRVSSSGSSLNSTSSNFDSKESASREEASLESGSGSSMDSNAVKALSAERLNDETAQNVRIIGYTRGTSQQPTMSVARRQPNLIAVGLPSLVPRTHFLIAQNEAYKLVRNFVFQPRNGCMRNFFGVRAILAPAVSFSNPLFNAFSERLRPRKSATLRNLYDAFFLMGEYVGNKFTSEIGSLTSAYAYVTMVCCFMGCGRVLVCEPDMRETGDCLVLGVEHPVSSSSAYSRASDPASACICTGAVLAGAGTALFGEPWGVAEVECGSDSPCFFVIGPADRVVGVAKSHSRNRKNAPVWISTKLKASRKVDRQLLPRVNEPADIANASLSSLTHLAQADFCDRVSTQLARMFFVANGLLVIDPSGGIMYSQERVVAVPVSALASRAWDVASRETMQLSRPLWTVPKQGLVQSKHLSLPLQRQLHMLFQFGVSIGEAGALSSQSWRGMAGRSSLMKLLSVRAIGSLYGLGYIAIVTSLSYCKNAFDYRFDFDVHSSPEASDFISNRDAQKLTGSPRPPFPTCTVLCGFMNGFVRRLMVHVGVIEPVVVEMQCAAIASASGLLTDTCRFICIPRLRLASLSASATSLTPLFDQLMEHPK